MWPFDSVAQPRSNRKRRPDNIDLVRPLLRRLERFALEASDLLDTLDRDNPKWSVVDDMLCDLHDDIIGPAAAVDRRRPGTVDAQG
jgi:hypothetical protein